MAVLNCRVEQTSNRTTYVMMNVQEINDTDCTCTWANGADKVNLVSSSNKTLITTDCYKSIDYTLGCMRGIYKAACTANCTENSDDVIRPKDINNGLSWGAIAIAVGIAIAVVLPVVALVIYLVKKKRFPCQARSGNLQPDARNEPANKEESVELNANGNHGQP